ncbi:hypothetical protein F0160_17720 [Paraburkholderia sp. JPY303]|nr:hypothetical protein [Paraburkholderia atlantica]
MFSDTTIGTATMSEIGSNRTTAMCVGCNMNTRTMLRRIATGLLAGMVLFGLSGCDALSGPPAPEWPGPHAPYPFPDDVPHRTQ